MPVIGAPPVLFQGRATVNQTHPTANTYYPLELAAEDFDTANAHSTTTLTSRFVAPRSGIYRCSASVLWTNGQATTAGTTNRVAGIAKNGVFLNAAAHFGTYAGALMTQTCLPVDVQLAAGDYLDIRVAAGLTNAQTYGDAYNGSMLRAELLPI